MENKKSIAQQFGENLKRIRQEKGVSRKELAAAIGISEVNFGKYERGERQPPLDKILRIADILTIPVTDLIGGNVKFVEDKIFEYRLQRAYQMARDFIDYLLNIEPNFDKEGHIVIFSPEKISKDEKGVFGYFGGINSVSFKTAEDFVKVMEQAENDALRQQINFNAAFRQIVFKEKPPK